MIFFAYGRCREENQARDVQQAAQTPQARDVQQAEKHRWQDTITLVQAFS